MAILYSYFRSSCSYRVRIALNLKNLAYEMRYINLLPGISQQFAADYRELNPQARVPFYIDDNVQLGQSWAIIDYLDEQYPHTPLLPSDAVARAQVRQIAAIVSADIQPLNNLAALTFLKQELQAEPSQVSEWYAKWVREGFACIESLLPSLDAKAAYCHGSHPGFADIFLIPQVWNALRFKVELSDFPKIMRIYHHCGNLDAFAKASPEAQLDAVS